ncbi:STM4014 family protein [Paraflavitalea pollutisoli]|uniref:STM4014 family protein n=1 Tax=Paraflavitalea pollutisoli TaxID=3034143 RepID=UPI0023EB6C1D|nr:STM4014 family protein [Paraflavitalea sp. H1-2-19X]
MYFVVIGNPENRRVTAFADAVRHLGAGEPVIVSYEGLLTGSTPLALKADSIVRIESPGENDLVRKLLVKQGGAEPDTDEPFGHIGNMRAWYRGYCQCLEQIEQVIDRAGASVMNTPADIQLLFDKPACQQLLELRGVPVPARLSQIKGYKDLLLHMEQQQLQRVFLKPAHGSSASGVVAFRKLGTRVQAITSVELVRNGAEVSLYNSRRVRTYTQEEDIAALVDRLVGEQVFAEAWLPKATLQQRYFDVRVLVINGRARHMVVRSSATIITNLHLGNRRADPRECIDLIGQEAWHAIQRTAEQAAACFPNSLYLGVDVLLTADHRRCFVLEVNAFGDLLPNLLHEGDTCYEAEIRSVLHRINRELC